MTRKKARRYTRGQGSSQEGLWPGEGDLTLTALLLVALISATLVMIMLFVPHCYGEPRSPGMFGDMFGFANALFSGVAFGALVLTLLLQRRDLHLQRDELRLTREELEGQRKALEQQADVAKRQSFEQTYFNLLHLHHELTGQLDLPRPHSRERARGRDAFLVALNNLKNRLSAVDKDARVTVDGVEQAFSKTYQEIGPYLSHYFRNVTRILEFVDTVAPSDSKKLYGKLFQSQLSVSELLLIFYYGRSSAADADFWDLAPRFTLFAGIDDKIFHQDDIRLYPGSAYFE